MAREPRNIGRGTAVQIGERHALLWTSGYVPRLDTYTGPETPNPISVRVLRGECALTSVLSDVPGRRQVLHFCTHKLSYHHVQQIKKTTQFSVTPTRLFSPSLAH